MLPHRRTGLLTFFQQPALRKHKEYFMNSGISTPPVFDLELIRRQFPALCKEPREERPIYLDGAAGTQVPQGVIDAVSEYYRHSNANLGGAFAASLDTGETYALAHQAMADFVGATSLEEIVFGPNMTSLTFDFTQVIGDLLQPGDEIILTRMDHDGNVTPWLTLAEEKGLEVKWLPFNGETFRFELETLQELIGPRTRFAAINYASNLLGTINDIPAICELLNQAEVLSYIDAVQYAPHGELDVSSLGCDFLVCSAYKFFGPHQGILWGRRNLLETLRARKLKASLDALPGKFETGTPAFELMAGTQAAVDYFAWVGRTFAGAEALPWGGKHVEINAGKRILLAQEQKLTRQLLAGLQSFNGVTIQGIRDAESVSERVSTVSFTVRGHRPEHLATALAQHHIACWSGHNYALQVVDQLDLMEQGGVVRVSPVHYNSSAEIDRFLEVLGGLLA